MLVILIIIIAVAVLIICATSQQTSWQLKTQNLMLLQTMPEHVQKQWRDAGRILVRNEASACKFLRNKQRHIHTCYAGHGRCSTYNGGPCREETLTNYPQLGQPAVVGTRS